MSFLNITGFLKGIISPKIALTALLKNLETEVKHEINWFRLVYTKETNSMFFEVLQPDNSKKRYTYPDGKNLITAIEQISKESLKSSDLLDVVVLIYEKNATTEFVIDSYYRNEAGEKLTKRFDL